MRKYYLLPLLFIATLLQAQSTTPVEQLIQKAEAELNRNPKESLAAATEARAAAEKNKDKRNAAIALSLSGVAHYKMDAYDKARAYIEQAVGISTDIKDTSNIAFCKYWLANLELNKGQYVKALDLYETGYALAKQIGDKKNIARCLDGEGSIYESLNENDKAMEFYQSSLDAAKEAGFKEWYSGIAFSMGNVLYNKGETDKAIAKYNEAITLADETKNLNGKANSYQQLASVYYYSKKDSKKAMDYIQQAMDIFQQTGSLSSFSYSRLLMSSILLRDKEYDLAIELAQASYAEGKQKGETQLQKNAAEVLYYAYAGKGDKARALDYHVLFHNLSENEREQELVKKLTKLELTTNFEKERQLAKAQEEKRNAELNAKVERQQFAQRTSIAIIILISIIAILAIYAFNEKRKDNKSIAREKQKSDELLLNILPAEVANELKESGHAKAKNYDMATVLFADIKNFTQAAELMTPEKLVAEIDYYFRNFDEIVLKHKVEKIKTIGDAYLCVGGLPIADTTNAIYVLDAAMEIQQFVADEQVRREKKGEIFFEVRIGIHSGALVAGIVGMRKFAYDIWGDTVNVAARMEQNGEEGKINLSGSTYELIKDKYSCNYRGKIPAKNKGQIDMYFIDKRL